MWTRVAATLAVIPFLLLAALVTAMPPLAPVTQASEPALPMPTVRAEFSGGTIVLSGVVPDAIERDAIVAHAASIYGRAQVVDRLHIAAVANPAWLRPSFLPDLRGLADAVAILDDARLVVEGVAQSIEARNLLGARLDPLVRLGLRVVNRVVVQGAPAAR